MEAQSTPVGFYDALTSDADTTARAPASEKKSEPESMLALQRQVTKLRNDVRTANTQLSLVRQQKTKANDELKVVDKKYEKKIRGLEKEVADQRRQAQQNLQLAKKIQDWNDEQGRQCTALVKKNEQCLNDRNELLLQIEAMDCLLNNLTPDQVRGRLTKTRPFSWYKECLSSWRVNLAKVEGKCKALEETIANQKKQHNKELSAAYMKAEDDRQKAVSDILVGLFHVSGLDQEQTIENIANDRGLDGESKECREEMVKLLDHILLEAAKKSASGSDARSRYAVLRQEANALPEEEKIALGSKPRNRPTVSSNTSKSTIANAKASIKVPSATRGSSAKLAISNGNHSPAVKVKIDGANKVSLTASIRSPQGKESYSSIPPPIPPKAPGRQNLIAGKAKAATPENVTAAHNVLREENKALQIIQTTQREIQRVRSENTKTRAILKQKIEEILALRGHLAAIQTIHCPNFPQPCTHVPPPDFNTDTKRCQRIDCSGLRLDFEYESKKIEELEEYASLIEPMAAIGTAVRIQFIEEARAALAGEEPNECIVRDGINAARAANGDLDNNLFAGADVLDDHPLYQTFQKIYLTKPREDWEDLPELLKKTIDSQATIRFAKNLTTNVDMQALLDVHKELSSRLIGRFQKFVDGKTEMYEANINHWFLLDRLEWLTDEILLFDEEKSLERYLKFLEKDDMNPKVRVKRWPGAEKERAGPGFGYIGSIHDSSTK
ncbi:hypothetical protein BKA65DRAFT_591889 [Rhexocercosporidium sp. MPI-PUGE-AT-0058]|nr:hypothetical protein BKA65DRAFT_591889 [Rhexocercosporidium sp. MPI-PUGE-AT-0058]